MIFISAEATGIGAAREAMRRLDDAVKTDPEGVAVTEALDWLERETIDFASQVTHQWTGTLFRSYTADEGPGLRTIFVSPDVSNPYGQLPAVYAAYEFARGGSHDAFAIATARANVAFVPQAARILVERALEEGNA